jgi:hypothetical protein
MHLKHLVGHVVSYKKGGISLNFKYVENTISAIKLKYKSLQKASSHPYSLRIINEEICAKNGETLFTLQITGKNLVSKLYATDISHDKKLLKSLSPIDLLKILNTYNKNYLFKKDNMILFPCKAYYRLIAKSYNHVLQKTFLYSKSPALTKLPKKN